MPILTKQDREEIAERAKEYKKEEELDWNQLAYVLLGIPQWRNDDELLDRIVELCDVSNVDELPFKTIAEALYLRTLEAKHERLAAYVEADSYVSVSHITSCIEDFDTAIEHCKQLIEKEQ